MLVTIVMFKLTVRFLGERSTLITDDNIERGFWSHESNLEDHPHLGYVYRQYPSEFDSCICSFGKRFRPPAGLDVGRQNRTK